MTRPAIELADIVRARGRQSLERFKAIFSYQQLKAFRAVLRCRTAALGGHKDRSVGCQYEDPISYNSCLMRSNPYGEPGGKSASVKGSRPLELSIKLRPSASRPVCLRARNSEPLKRNEVIALVAHN
jgi:Transposase zinc-binding domain